MHCIENPPMYRLESIPSIWQCPTHNDAHGVFQVRLLHLVPQIRRDNPLLGGTHRTKNSIKIKNLAAKSRKVAKNASFQPDMCQILLLSFKILTQFPSSQSLQLGAKRRGTSTA
jgi:hypothetical protein